MNVVMTGSGRFVEVQGTAEGMPFTRGELDELLALAEGGHRPAAWRRSGGARRRRRRRGERPAPARSGSCSPPPTRTRRPRSRPSSRRGPASSCCPARPSCPTSRRPARPCSRTRASRRWRCRAATGLAGGGRRHRSRGRRPRGRPGRVLGPLRRRGRDLRRQRGQAAGRARPRCPTAAERAGPAFGTVALVPFPDGTEVWAEGVGRRAHRRRSPRGRRLRLRPGVRPRRGRRPDLRRDAGAEKHETSHRGRAFRALGDRLAQRSVR